jgi:hypothetical protein
MPKIKFTVDDDLTLLADYETMYGWENCHRSAYLPGSVRAGEVYSVQFVDGTLPDPVDVLFQDGTVAVGLGVEWFEAVSDDAPVSKFAPCTPVPGKADQSRAAPRSGGCWEGRTVAELLAIAAERGVVVRNSWPKSTIIATLAEAERAVRKQRPGFWWSG